MAPFRLPARRSIGVVAALALLIGMSVSGQAVLPLPASASVGSEEDPDPLPAELDEGVEPGESVPAMPTADVEPVPAPPESAPAAPAPEYPEAATEELPVTEEPPAEDDPEDLPGTEGADGDVAFPVAVWMPPDGEEPPGGGSTDGADEGPADVPATVAVEVLAEDAVASLGGLGLAFTVTRSDGVGKPGAVSVDAVYDSFRFAAGGNLASRLKLVAVPGCALTTPKEPSCQQRTPLAAENQLKSGLLRAVVEATGDPAGEAPQGRGLEGLGLDDVPVGQIYVVESSAGSSLGDYGASPLPPNGRWTVGVGSGDFTWSEALPSVPLPQGGTGSGPALAYSSGSVDGRTTAKNPQASWAGIGWEVQAGSIDQAFQSCTDAGYPAGGTDSCVYTGVGRYTISLNGQTSTLVPVAGVANAYRLREDPGWQVKLDTTANSWTVLTPDGTRYYFGHAATSTESTWTVPVNGPGGYQDMPWRWALSHVRDTSNNMVAYYYDVETNYFHATGGNMDYVRAGRLERIEFGRIFDDNELSNLETGALDFVEAFRCKNATCPSPPSDATSLDFPDVPVDLLCAGGSDPCTEEAPTFFTDHRLASVTSSVETATGFEPVDQVVLTHALVDPPQVDDADAQLWLSSVQNIGLDGATADVPLPATSFTGVSLNSRADAISSYAYRLSGIYPSTGASIAVTYSQPTVCPPSELVGAAENGDWDCFVDIGRRDNSDVGYVWYRKWLVASVTTAPVVGGQNPLVSQTSTYYYKGPNGDAVPQVHHDSYAISADDLTFSIYRGYAEVKVTTGTTTPTIDVYRVFRGMHLDRDTTGYEHDMDDTSFDDLPNAHGLVLDDWDWFRGRVYEHARYSGSTLVEVSTTEPGWAALRSPPPSEPPNYDGTASKMVVDAAIWTTVDVPGGTDRTARIQYSYDADGLRVGTIDHGDIAAGVTSDDRCTATSYVKNSATWVLVPSEIVLRPGLTCADPAPVASRTRILYDSQGWGVAPLRGLPTEVRRYSTATAYSSTSSSYDSVGRVTAVTDPNGNTTITAFTPSDPQLGLPNATTVTNELGHVTATTLHPRRRLPVTTTDPNGHVSTAQYDAVGRLSKVWLPTEPTSGPASLEYLYDLALDKSYPPKVTSRTLQSIVGSSGAGTYLSSYIYYDGLAREQQTQVVAPTGTGRIVTSTRYDDRGLVAAQTEPMHMSGAAGSAIAVPVLTDIPSETRTTYDALGRPITTKLFSNGVEVPGKTTTTTYNGTSTTATDAAGAPVTTHVDAHGRTTGVTEQYYPTNHWLTGYTYDSLDNLTTITDDLGNVTTYGYDMLSRRTSADDPDTGLWTYTYDSAGNRLKTTDAKGDATIAGYDELNRQIELRKFSAFGTGALLSSWTYDNGGRKGLLVAAISHVDGAEYKINNMMYDARNRLTAKTYVIPTVATGLAGSYTFGYGYDRADHPTSITYPNAGGLSAETVTTNFSDRGYEVSTAGSHTYIAATTYKNYGLLARRDYGGTGSLVRKYSYDTATRWLDNLATDFNAATPQDSSYGYDLVGNITSIDTGSAGDVDECFAYDPANRLIEAITKFSPTGTCNGSFTAGYNQAFRYDSIGRITVRDVASPIQETEQDHLHYNPSAPHAVADVEHVGGTNEPPFYIGTTATYEYDANGNRTMSTTGVGAATTLDTSYTWNSQHQLVETTVDDGTTTETSAYIYDADGKRLIRDDGTTKTLYLDNTEITPAGATQPSIRYYTTADGVLVGLRTAGDPWHRVVLNHQGSTQYTIQNNTATIRQVSRYEPYGKTKYTNGLPTDRRYLHAPNDDQTGLIQLGARYYDPDLAQFISPDPLVAPFSPQSLHGYSNSLNNPVTYSDPTGLYPIEGGGEGGYNPPPGYDPPYVPNYNNEPPDWWIPDGPWTGEVGENRATFLVELLATGAIQGMPGVTSVPITEWEYHYWNVEEQLAARLATADNHITVQHVVFVATLVVPGGLVAKGLMVTVKLGRGALAAAKSSDELFNLYRHVGPNELADLRAIGQFRAGGNSMSGKWFAESSEHAAEWGARLNRGQGGVVVVRVPSSFADSLMRLEKLDGIGPARYVDYSQLDDLNRLQRGIGFLP